MKCQNCEDNFDEWDMLECDCGSHYCLKCSFDCINSKGYCNRCIDVFFEKDEDKKVIRSMWIKLTNEQKKTLRSMILYNEIEV